ncbi:MAG: iron-only hydrogenase system regulator [Lachnospiraceae bacterium]|nr:iron-only hydrogenase system regulator [Lachnospiraceae bacterium]
MENRRIEQEKNKEAAIEEIATETGKPVEQTRIALIGIIVEDLDSVERMNSILHEAGEYIIGRMGIPRVKGSVNVISVVVDAPEEKINGLSGKLGMCKGITSKVIYGKMR